MNNGQTILSNITFEMIADGIHEKYCSQSKCEDCPVHGHCNEIYNTLERADGIAPSCYSVILYWLKQYKDYIFYSHIPTNKHKVYSDKDYQYYFRNRCNVCQKPTNTYGIATISISGTNQSYRVLGKICEDCFPKLCKILKIDIPDFSEPCFYVSKLTHKDTGGTYCSDCGRKSPKSYSYCPRCGQRLER